LGIEFVGLSSGTPATAAGRMVFIGVLAPIRVLRDLTNRPQAQSSRCYFWIRLTTGNTSRSRWDEK